MAGVTVPIIPMAHQYLFTHAIEGVHPGLPTMRDPDNLCYFREEVGGLCMGGYERDPAPWSLDGVPADFNHRLLDPDWPRFESIMEGAIRRVPAIADAGVTRMINGPEAFTPDNEFILGESEVRGFFVAAGFCAHGIAGTGGIGQQVARWIVDGEPELDLWKMDIRRFGGQYRSQKLTLARTYENYATYYDIHYPNEERLAARPLRLSPAYDELAALGAVFGEKSMWERPNWFTPNEDGAGVTDAGRARGAAAAGLGGRALVTRRSAPRRSPPARTPGSSTNRASPRSRSRAPGRSAYLQYLCDNDIDKPVGSDRLHPDAQPPRRHRVRLHRHAPRRRPVPDRHRHGVRQSRSRLDPEAPRRDDGSVRRPGHDLVACLLRALGTEGTRHPRAAHQGRRLERRLPVHDGPRDHDRARSPCSRCASRTSASSAGSSTARRIRQGALATPSGTRARPTASPRAATARSTHCGSRRATASGRATSPRRRRRTKRVSDSPSRLDKGADFIGREALVAAKAAGPRKRLRCLVLDDPRSVALGNEPVRIDGRIVGRVTTGGYGFAVERSIAYAYLPPDQAAIGTRGEVEMFGEWIGFEVAREPLWDPEGARIRS